MTDIPTIHEIRALLDDPLQSWFGGCFKIARFTVERMDVPGRAAYGWWTGSISDIAARMFKRNAQGHVRHGWVVMPDGLIFDPTRWTLTGATPSVYYGPNDFYARGQFISWWIQPHAH